MGRGTKRPFWSSTGSAASQNGTRVHPRGSTSAGSSSSFPQPFLLTEAALTKVFGSNKPSEGSRAAVGPDMKTFSGTTTAGGGGGPSGTPQTRSYASPPMSAPS